MAWAMMVTGERYKEPVALAAYRIASDKLGRDARRFKIHPKD